MARKHFEVETKDTGKYNFDGGELKISEVENIWLDGKCIVQDRVKITEAKEKNNKIDILKGVCVAVLILLMVILIFLLELVAKREEQNRLSLVVALWGLLTTFTLQFYSPIKKIFMFIFSLVTKPVAWLFQFRTKPANVKTTDATPDIWSTVLIHVASFDLAGAIVAVLLKTGKPIEFANTVSALAVILPVEILVLKQYKVYKPRKRKRNKSDSS